MSRVSFEPTPNTYGEYYSINLIKVWGSGVDELLSRLTVINKATEWEIKRLSNMVPSNPKRGEEIKSEIKALQDKLVIEYFSRTEAGEHVIPAGFWFMVESLAGHLNTEVAPITSSFARDYQIEAVHTALKYKRSLIVAATGLGKSLIILDICSSFVAAGKRVCVIVPTVDLVTQMVSQLKEKFNVSGAGGKFKYKVGCEVLISTPITAKQYIDRFDTVIIDEIHHQSANTWFALGFAAKQANYFYGLTATPIRSDNLDIAIHGWAGPVVFNRDAAWAIENKWLTPTEVTMIKVQGLKTLPATMPSISVYGILMKSQVTLECLFKVISSLLKKNHKVMVLLATVKSGEMLAKYCKERGLEFQVAHAKYRAPFYAFKKADTNLLVGNHKLFGEGIDVPNITAIVNVCNIKSESLTRQIVGRAVRLFPGKEKAVVVDVFFPTFHQFKQSARFRKSVYETITDSIKEIDYERSK